VETLGVRWNSTRGDSTRGDSLRETAPEETAPEENWAHLHFEAPDLVPEDDDVGDPLVVRGVGERDLLVHAERVHAHERPLGRQEEHNTQGQSSIFIEQFVPQARDVWQGAARGMQLLSTHGDVTGGSAPSGPRSLHGEGTWMGEAVPGLVVKRLPGALDLFRVHLLEGKPHNSTAREL